MKEGKDKEKAATPARKQPAAKEQPVKAKPAPQPSSSTFASSQPLVAEVRRHWFGLFSLYALMLGGFLLIALIFFMLDADLWLDNLALVASLSLSLLILFVPLCFLINYVYWGNIFRIYETEVRLLARRAVFYSKFSILGLANVEDVTFERQGVFAHVMDYGTLNVETAGEQENFIFKYCPRPEKQTRLLMETREKYLKAINQDQQTLR